MYFIKNLWRYHKVFYYGDIGDRGRMIRNILKI